MLRFLLVQNIYTARCQRIRPANTLVCVTDPQCFLTKELHSRGKKKKICKITFKLQGFIETDQRTSAVVTKCLVSWFYTKVLFYKANYNAGVGLIM